MWEDLDSSNSKLKQEEASIGMIVNTVYNSTSDEFDEELELFDLHSLQLAYHEALSNTSKITTTFKDMKRSFKNACKDKNKNKTIKLLRLSNMKSQ